MFDFTVEKQKVLIELLLGNQELFARCNTIIKPSYFDPSIKKSVSFIQEYFETYREIPNAHIIKAETNFDVEFAQLTKGEQAYAAEEIEKFCQLSEAIEWAFKGPELIEQGNVESLWQGLKAAASISLNRDLGISYFDNVEARLNDLLMNSPTIPTGWNSVDEVIGGIARQELLLLAGASGVGKSVTMSNLAINVVAQGFKGVYFSLELADRVVGKRFDSMVTMIGQSDILKNITTVAEKVQGFHTKCGGELYIKRMPENVTTANHIRAYMKEFQQTHGYAPDFIVVDYLDLMSTNRGVSNENIWLADKYKAEELRAIGFEFDCAIVTASQLGRASLDAEKVGQQHIQGGYSKVQTADNMIAIVQTDQMRDMGIYVFEFTKTRNSSGVGSSVEMTWDPISLRISDSNKSEKLSFQTAKSKAIETILETNYEKKQNLLDFVKH
jgi:hypothetical protein